MPNYRRWFVPGGTYFFTCVTHRRTPFLTQPLARTILHEAIDTIQKRFPFEVVAIVLLPDHWHTVWTLPPGDDRYPTRWRRIKEEFTEKWLAQGGLELVQSLSRRKHRMRGVWQKRYWEHAVRDEADLERCVDYIHWNPCKHKLVSRVQDWPWSSFQRFVAEGQYEADWGRTDPVPDWHMPEWGGEI
jgi:putative transposase